jgi:glycosyltransferase involved in cell wall biosynthesis
MCNLLVNALSVTNPSGRHVLLGHLNRIAESLPKTCRLVLICRRDMEAFRTGIQHEVEWEWAPSYTQRWWGRTLWERLYLKRLARRYDAAAYFTPSGMAAHELGIPQLVFAQNPWALVPSARRRRDAFKAGLQRRAYRRSMRVADVMVFNSAYMQQAYRENAGHTERRGLVVCQAIDETTRSRAAASIRISRHPFQVLTVSVMAPHKNIETLVRAFQGVHQTHSQARLMLAGSWPDSGYELRIREEVHSLGLDKAVVFAGFVSREELDQLYAESRVFCLMSRCESFGIPSIEAQLFGTPVISSTVCAIPEICGEGGRFCDPDDVPGIASALEQLLTDEAEWQRCSEWARANAERYTWQRCSKPLVDLVAEYTAPDQ